MKPSKKLYSTLALMVGMSLSVVSNAHADNAQNEISAQQPQMPQVLIEAQEKGYFTIIDSTPVEEYPDLRAVLTRTANGQFNLYWVNEKQNYVNVGALIQGDGINIANKYTEKLKPSIGEAFKEIHNGGLILGNDVTTNDDGVMYVFVEPHCGYCKRLERNLEPYIEKGLNVRYIPLSWMSPNTPDIIATIAKSDDKVEAMSQALRSQLKITTSSDQQIMAGLNKNSSIMRAVGLTGTPGVVYKNESGKYTLTGGLDGKNLENLANYLMKQGKMAKVATK
ncbi:thioredoxin fold domain-containing protein [Vibrio vulnificus]|uniref:Thioredoxin-like fold domain-containing protein n=1 Tax=Vibrio vulnificus TaxID=672 RepID=A0A2S3R2H1_VIBVL|nr:thioredoxin fold domain-containing protein [Vibrio vulnificus]POB47293.1 hypothetical protein CRN52_14525 [Vibrio vulnificus]